MIWWWGKAEHSQETHTINRKNTLTPHRENLPQPRIEPRSFLLSDNRANHYTTVHIYKKIDSGRETLRMFFSQEQLMLGKKKVSLVFPLAALHLSVFCIFNVMRLSCVK